MTTQAASPGATREPSLWPAILLATLAGAIARGAPVFAAGFPINDGGLFASMVDDILHSGQAIPTWTSYDGLNGPFAYPPLAFLVTAGLETIAPLGTVEWLRWLPLVASIATVPAFYLLAAEVAPSRVHAVVATFAFALVPRSFEWMVMGGGLTRAPGFLLAILAIALGLRSLRAGGRAWLGTGVALGLTALTHPSAALFAGISLGLASLAFARTRQGWARMAMSAVVAGLVASPWVLLVVYRHGIEPIVSAGGTGINVVESLFYLVTGRLTEEPFFPLIVALGLAGVVESLVARRLFVPVWAAVLVLADPRASATFITVPLSILAAVGLLDVVVARALRVDGDLRAASGWPSPLLRGRGVRAIIGTALGFSLLAALLAPQFLEPMATLDVDQRAAMSWGRESLPDDARVVVVTGRVWFQDATSEWFPYLADRVSVATVQGYEWMGSAAWQRQRDLADDLITRCRETAASLEAWAREWGIDYEFVYVPKDQVGAVLSPEDCCPALRTTLVESADYEVVYDGPGATVVRRTGP